MCNSDDDFFDSFPNKVNSTTKRFNFKKTNNFVSKTIGTNSTLRTENKLCSIPQPTTGKGEHFNEPVRSNNDSSRNFFINRHKLPTSLGETQAQVSRCNKLPNTAGETHTQTSRSTPRASTDDLFEDLPKNCDKLSSNAVNTSSICEGDNDDDDFFESFKNKDFSKIKRFNFKKFTNSAPQTKDTFNKNSAVTSRSINIGEEKSENLICKETHSDSSSIKVNGVKTPVKSSFLKINSTQNSDIHKKLDKNSINSPDNKCEKHVTYKSETISSKPKTSSSGLQLRKLEKPVHSEINNLTLNPRPNISVSPFFQRKDCKSSERKLLTDSQNNLKVVGSARSPHKKDTNYNDMNNSCKEEKQSTSPVIKPKKFIFKKTSSGRSLSQSLLSEHTKSPTKKVDERLLQKEPSYISVSSSESIDNEKCTEKIMLPEHHRDLKNYISDFKPVKDSIKQSDCSGSSRLISAKGITLNDEVSCVSQSLQATDADYMDDEEFERMFGGVADSIFESEKIPGNNTKILGNPVSKSKSESEDVADILNDISDMNWDEDAFTEEVPAQSNTVGIFDNRQDHTPEFCGNYPHSEVMLEVLHQKFGLRSFRPHQREIINASLTGHDCFVLMPTGGGKSLCYQLPAVLMPGVTIVISPLRALISDQVDKMNGLDIASAHLCADVSKDDAHLIMTKLHVREPLIKLLYLTPEKINASRAVIDVLDSLYNRGKLARFVIDEAHCLSQWGHDFRPDYKQLSMLRTNYNGVPIICLTATATKQVENDVINILKLKNVRRFITSFNRPNIKYQVLEKPGVKTTLEISNLIKKKFSKMSGIIYCLCRKDCDLLAEDLNKFGIKAKPYHAGMKDKVREVIQREWMQDRFHVIVATIAFGMGIDKPDVRFVIHNSVPKSVEAFYQESGRAGRDGEISYSYLFYSYRDVARLQRLMQMERKNMKALSGHFDNLNQMVAFAENVVDCRRHLQLIHLGEKFDRNVCIRNKATICDNCENIDKYKTLDLTKEAKELCSIIKDLSAKDNVTLLHIVDVYRGSKIQKILQKGHNKHRFYGAGVHLDKHDVQRILKELLIKHILQDHCVYTGEFPQVYMIPGPKFDVISKPGMKFAIPVSTNKSIKSSVRFDDIRVPLTEEDSPEATPKASSSSSTSKTLKKAQKAPLSKLTLLQLKIQCHEDLLEECRRLAVERNLTLSSVMNLSAIKSMSEVLPSSKEEFLKIQHVTNANYNKFGEFFLTITKKYREKVDVMEAAAKEAVPEDEEDIWSSSATTSSRNQVTAVKRKASTGTKYPAKRYKKTKRKARSPKKAKATKKNAPKWLQKKGGGGGGKLTLMPIHIK